MSGVGFFSKSINPNPAIPIRYRLPEIVHFKATEILSTDLIFCQRMVLERRTKLEDGQTSGLAWFFRS